MGWLEGNLTPYGGGGGGGVLPPFYQNHGGRNIEEPEITEVHLTGLNKSSPTALN